MALEVTFETITVDQLHALAEQKFADGWRCVQIFTTHDDVTQLNHLTYTFAKDCIQANYQIKDIKPEDEIPSISDVYLSCFVYENEAHDLFGVKIKGIVIDFEGHFYDLPANEPMTILSPEKKAAMERAAKVKAAKAAKEAKAKAAAAAAAAPKPAAGPVIDAEMEAKLAAMDPEKAAKMRAALEAKAKREAAKAAEAAAAAAKPVIDAEMEAKLAAMDPEKAAKVRAAMEAKAAREAAKNAEGGAE